MVKVNKEQNIIVLSVIANLSFALHNPGYEAIYICGVIPYSGETLARFLIWRIGYFAENRQI